MTDKPLTADAPSSIVDEIFDLDELLSGDVRLAEKTVYICTKPHLEAEIDELEQRLSTLVDATGAPVDTESALGDGETAQSVAQEIQSRLSEMAASMRPFRFRQLPEEDWTAFRARHKAALAGDNPDVPLADLVVLCAVAPKISADQLARMRKKFGGPQVDKLEAGAWHVNTQSGVSVPKSLSSSRVLKQSKRG